MANTMPGNDEIVNNVNDSFSNLDKQRISGLEKMIILQGIKTDALEREKIRLSKKYGDGHPRVNKITDRLAYNKGLKKELENEVDEAKIIVPEFDKDTWMVHGRLLNTVGKGVKGYTVALRDEKGNWIKDMKYCCTDERGYFALRCKVKSERDSVISEDMRLFLTVTDEDFKIIHREQQPLLIKPSQIDFRIIILDREGGICMPPEKGMNDT